MDEKAQARLDVLLERGSHRQVMSQLRDIPSVNSRDELFETMARAAQERLPSRWEDLDESERRESCEIAKEYLRGIVVAGYFLVPVVVTEEIEKAYLKHHDSAQACHDAMRAAAQKSLAE